MKSFYDNRATDIPDVDRRLDVVANRIAALRPASVLDLACGRGALLRRLGKTLPASRLVGGDIAPSSIEAVGVHGLEAHVVDVSHRLPFEDETFECVVFGEVIEHIVDPDFALREIARVLRVDGTVIVTTPNLASWFNRALLLVGIQPIFTETSLEVNLGRRFDFLGQHRPTQGHLKIFTLAALREMLEANGFQVDWIRGAPFPEANRLSGLDRVLARWPHLASNFVVSATNRRTLRTSYPKRDGWHER